MLLYLFFHSSRACLLQFAGDGVIDYMEYIDLLMTFTDDIRIKLKGDKLTYDPLVTAP